MGGDLVEQQDRAAPARSATRSARARIRPISSAFCSPVEQSDAGWSLPRWVTMRSVRCGPARVRPAAASRDRPSASACGEIRLVAALEREAGAGERAFGRLRRAARRAPRRRRLRASATPRRHARPSAPRARSARPRRAAHPRQAICCGRASPLRSGRHAWRGRDRAPGPAGRGSGGGPRRRRRTAGPSPA